MILSYNTTQHRQTKYITKRVYINVCVYLMLMYDENSQIMFAILLTLVSCHINTDIHAGLGLTDVWFYGFFYMTFTLCKRKTKTIVRAKGSAFFLYFEEEEEIKYTIILKVFISYAKRMYNLWIYINEGWLDNKL